MICNLTDCNKTYQRNVASGKVYRQMFDAEVQLVSSLMKSKSEIEEKWSSLKSVAREPKILLAPPKKCYVGDDDYDVTDGDGDDELRKVRRKVSSLPDIIVKQESSSRRDNILERVKNMKSAKL
ncbi:hypothetical protein HELRODRAFT_180526 [Helobdella robusta]|uniref:Uncharacterized protein n=1 Tax=Helobdella robusta TaxID=6412 RepID=T1FG06_HELRO|nr:hypothetical protein HELRODRAFT_180526 [Helobdella robusta]ESN93873.1 hypothetical protein HELRODRAFT_180526 [Helobdella robusta]